MRILYVGDVFGTSGLKAIENKTKTIFENYKIDFAIINGENSAIDGKGISFEAYKKFLLLGYKAILMGNHTYRNNDIFDILQIKDNKLIVPLNLKTTNKSYINQGSKVFQFEDKKIRISQVLLESFVFPEPFENPYKTLDNLFDTTSENEIHIVDLHGETTSEKICIAHNYDGKASAFFGTHTHIQTNDERILPKGSAYITDVGMTGVYYSAIGANFKEVIAMQKNNPIGKFFPAFGKTKINGVIFEINQDNQVISIEKLNIDGE